MAEPTGPVGPELDATLRDAFQRAARPGDSAGVADAIRSRVAAGDTGTSVTASTAPGWGGGIAAWLPWLGLVAAAGVLGGGLGVAGVFAPTDEAAVSPYHVAQVTTPGYQCPGGPAVTELGANERVLAVARDDESAWLQVRDPRDLATLVWLPARVVTVDTGHEISALPVGEGCPEEVGYEVEPEPDASQQPQPPGQPQPGGPPAPPPPAGDTTSPSVTSAYGTPNPVYAMEPVSLSVTASDDVAVEGVTVSWSGQYSDSKPKPMTFSGGSWRYTFVPPTNETGTITFTFVARDAAGNTSSPATVVITHQYFG